VTATTRFGRLQVKENQLCNDKGEWIQLRGMSTHGLQWYPWKGEKSVLNETSLNVLSREWNADILRISMYPDESDYKCNTDHYHVMIDTLVDEVLKRGMYCIIDWHMLSPGDPWYNIEHAKRFFARMSSQHGKKRFVIYEICNEPNSNGHDPDDKPCDGSSPEPKGKSPTWQRIKSYAEQIIPIIRANDPDGLIIVGTPAWSSLGISDDTPSGDDILENRLSGEFAHNVLYSFHFYAKSHNEPKRRTEFEKFAKELPIFVSEWGSQEDSGDGINDFVSTVEWLKLLDRFHISACNWNYSNDERSGAVWKEDTSPDGRFTDSELKEAGVFVKKWIQRAPDWELSPS